MEGLWVQTVERRGIYRRFAANSPDLEFARFRIRPKWILARFRILPKWIFPDLEFRTDDIAGVKPNRLGKYYHLLLVRVLCGNSLNTRNTWCREHFKCIQNKLVSEYDSVEGGPHQPARAGPYTGLPRSAGHDDSILYVAYQRSQFLPEFIVTLSNRVEPLLKTSL